MAKTPQEQARELAQSILGPQIATTNEAYRNKGASADAAYRAVANMQKGVAPQIEQTYGAASAREAVIAKGLALGAQLAGQETSGQANQLLAQNQSPQQVKAGDIGAVLASLGGLSAQGLNREGAAFSAAARFLPTMSRNLGVDAIKSARSEGAAAVSALEGKRPELVQGMLNNILEGQRADRALNINEWYLDNALRKTGAEITGVDPSTGLPTFASAAEVAADAKKAREKKQEALGKRNEATANAFLSASDWIETQLKPGEGATPKGQVPIVSHTVKRGKNTVTHYVKEGGGTTTKVAEAATKTVYDTQPLAKPEYNKLLRQLQSRLTGQLRRFGYKPPQIRSMAVDLLDDYFSVTERVPPTPNLPPQSESTGRRGGK